MAVGAVVVPLPDSGDRVLSLSGAHGPSALDLAGIALLLVGWLLALVQIVRRRARLRAVRSGARLAGTFALGLGAGLVVASALSDYAWWWAVGAVLAALVQGAALVAVLR